MEINANSDRSDNTNAQHWVRLSSISVQGLFGRFNHQVSFQEEEDLTIIIAPNGFGKTIILRIIDSFLGNRLRFFIQLDFLKIEMKFSNGLGIRIEKIVERDLFFDNSEKRSDVVHFTPIGGDDTSLDPFVYSIERDERFIEALERRLLVRRVGQDRWFDIRSEEIVSTDELIIKYTDELPPSSIRKRLMPDWLKELSESSNSRLIVTERLLSIETEDQPSIYGRRGIKSETVVEKDAKDLSRKIIGTVNKYATEAQKLDQTFPKRIIEGRHTEVPNEEDIRKRLQYLSDMRENLFKAGLIGERVGEPISPTDDLSDDNIRRILSIYVSDTDQKLGVFHDIYAKVSLFKNIINEHFLFKKIAVSQNDGITAHDIDSEKRIKLSDLSSGEQHELVLIYELLFKVSEGSIILIDEPELSLHVGWQKKFIGDIQKIQKLRRLQVVIATHSPQIISDQWDLVQELSNNE